MSGPGPQQPHDWPGWVYIMTHPAWDRLGMVKIGRTGRDPRTRAREITSSSSLLTPGHIAWCAPVPDAAAVEAVVHRMLGRHHVRKGRQLFRDDVAMAREVIKAVAGFLPVAISSPAPVVRAGRASMPIWRNRLRPSRSVSWRPGRRGMMTLFRFIAGVAAIISWVTLIQPLLRGGWPF